MKNIAILGSTGSIGTQALDVIEKHPDRFTVEVLTANNNTTLLIEQARQFRPNVVVIANEEKYDEVRDALAQEMIKVYAGADAVAQVVSMSSIDVVLTAMVGYSGLLPTINAIQAGKTIALANKETMVVAGELIVRMANEKKVDILPVDSEHSAIFQCLAGEFMNPIEKVILTCSGGPFHGMSAKALRAVSPEDALKHPSWDMGAKITIDSASLMNKGFEVIEAKWLFGLKPEQIDVVVHPQSIIHSLVQFEDGALKAQLGMPDMRVPIQYALAYPERLASDFPRFRFSDYPTLTFDTPDTENFRNLALSYEALHQGGNIACSLNASNEIAVKAFLDRKIAFTEMACINEAVMMKTSLVNEPSYEDYVETDREARERAVSLVNENS
jgi:1-deoxy-D-xylulose-5-phosphate reductoisomerase